MSRLMTLTTVAVCSILFHAAIVSAVAAQPAPDAIVGDWWTEGKEGRIRFVRSPDGTYAGIIAGNDAGSNAGIDVNNKDPALRKRRLLGAVIIWHLRPDDGEYVDGYVYNPRNGETYRIKAELTGKTTLKIRGYLGISLFGQSQTWTRAD